MPPGAGGVRSEPDGLLARTRRAYRPTFHAPSAAGGVQARWEAFSVSGPEAPPTASAIAALIDHTLLDPGADERAIVAACECAIEHGFAGVCIAPVWVARAAQALRGHAVRTVSVVGFPTGAHTTATKVQEALSAIEDGAGELDVVIALGALKSGDWVRVHRDLETVVVASRGGAIVKAILETSRLTLEEKKRAARVALETGAAFVKTSTGFGGVGATVEDVRLLREVVG